MGCSWCRGFRSEWCSCCPHLVYLSRVFWCMSWPFSGVPLRWMSRLTGGLLICHSPLRWVMLVLLSSCPLCYLFVPFVLLCWGGVRFPGEFGVLVHPRLRWNRLWRSSRNVWWPLHSPYRGACHSSQTQKTSYCRLFFISIFFFFTWLNEFSCFQRWVVFCQAAWKSNCRHCWCIVTLHACWVVNKNVLLAFYSVSSVLFRDKRRSIKEQNAMKRHNKTQT